MSAQRIHHLIRLQDDIAALEDLLHEHLRNRELYEASPAAWRLVHLNYREQLDRTEAELAELLRGGGGCGGPVPDGQHA